MLDKRRHARFGCDLRAEIRIGPRVLAARAQDISRGGICLACDEALAVAQAVQVALTLVLAENTFSEPLKLPARVVWCTDLGEGFQLGCRFAELDAERARYLEMFLRFLRGDVRAQDDQDDEEVEDPDEEVDPDAEPFG